MLSRKKRIRLEIRISEEDKAKLNELKELMDTSEGDVIREALSRFYLTINERKAV